MPASYLSPSMIHHLRTKGRWGWLLALCWLFLNAQLAIAGHQCDLTINQTSAFMQHQTHLQQTVSHGAHHHDEAMSAQVVKQQTPLCEKHCVPDTIKQDYANLALLAIPVSNELALANQPYSVNCTSDVWFSPPAAGPPAEIRFCRFRE
ncbi:hypothetical protein B4923_07070 [Brenneria roseae subsp. americana]|uniref:DUF2946 domain-containing protein n=1 Tax=Brenneria roseae subsp. americana TaxID=1508507 RepID=A0A2U1TWI0_9GAMM|nr:hypothetical protein [Brenneria roseae]PWC13702.1 hypothetical protein B4923_07070 [Brenneria roseae subsp. americana]